MEKLEIRDMGLNLEVNGVINVIGAHGSGKTTLIKMLINQIQNNTIYLDDKEIASYDLKFLRKNIAGCLNNFNFNTGYVKEELFYYQDILEIPNNIALDTLNKFSKFFGIDDLLESKITMLTLYEKAYLKILSLLIINPSILAIDDMLTYLTTEEKLKIIKYAKENNICLINITTNKEELLLGSKIVVLDNHKVIASDINEKIFADESLFSKVGMKYPFIVDLSNGLNYYEVLKRKYFDAKGLIGAIWK